MDRLWIAKNLTYDFLIFLKTFGKGGNCTPKPLRTTDLQSVVVATLPLSSNARWGPIFNGAGKLLKLEQRRLRSVSFCWGFFGFQKHPADKHSKKIYKNLSAGDYFSRQFYLCLAIFCGLNEKEIQINMLALLVRHSFLCTWLDIGQYAEFRPSGFPNIPKHLDMV